MLVLVVEDNRALASNTIEFLEAHGFECDYAANGHLAIELAMKHAFKAIILDVMLPGKDGLNICAELRAAGIQTPVLMLTARDTLADKLKGFSAGADDYLVKPFDLLELVARVQVLTKRHNKMEAKLRVSDLLMDLDMHTLSRAGQNIKLNNACWKILEALMKNHPKVLTREQLECLLWPDQLPDSDALKSHIYKLRQSIDKPFSSPLIHTIRGVGLAIGERSDDQ